ncbi:MAG: hypothetical protein ACYDBB_08290 [Armatimonadota bacterium]
MITSRSLLITLILFALCSVGSLCHAEEPVMATLFAGKDIPLSLKLRELDGNWRRLLINEAKQDVLLPLLMRMSEDPGSAPSFGTVYYTTGRTISIAGETYLAAYSVPKPTITLRDMEHGDTPLLRTLLTRETTLVLTLLNLRTVGHLQDIRIFDLDQEVAGDKAAMTKMITQAEQKAKEATLRANLQQLRNAIGQFEADTGVYPATLSDLVAKDEGRLQTVVIPAGAYKGPYLTPGGVVREALGLPANPFVDLKAAQPDPGKIATHWKYSPRTGMVTVPDTMAETQTVDGTKLGQL